MAIARSEANLQSARAKLAELEVREAKTHATLAIEQRALRLVEEEKAWHRTILFNEPAVERGVSGDVVANMVRGASDSL